MVDECTSAMLLDRTALDVRMIDGELRMRDLDLGAALEFERPRDIRKLVARILNKNEVCATVERTSGEGGRPARQYWLTEEQALLVVTKSETPRALELTRAIVRVFRAALRGELVPVRLPNPWQASLFAGGSGQ